MKIFLRQLILVSLMLVALWGTCLGQDDKQSGFDIYFFGQNLKTFENSNWFRVAVGATASLIAHELGHVLALELAGKSWESQASLPFGFAVHTDESLDNSERLNIGRAGFAFQFLIGFGLTSFESTRRSDFTKGWVTMNTLQISSYRNRPHDIDDDFAMIDRGGGNSDLEFSIFSLISLNNQLRLESDPWAFMTKSFSTPHFESDNIIEPIEDTNDVLIVETDLDLSETFLPKVKLSRFYPQDAFDQTRFQWADTLLAKSQLSN